MIYLDNAATTRPDPEAFDRAQAYCSDHFYNPSARYGGGFAVASAVGEARENLLAKIADPGKFELIFTSGGTESDNQAVFSCARRGNAVTTAGEHAAVERPFSALKNRGVEPRFAPLNRDGSVNAEALLSLVDEKTSLVSVIHVNNETGAINDVRLINTLVKARNPKTVTFSDGAQAVGKIPVNLRHLGVDLYSFAGHKIHCSKGIGALYVRDGFRLAPTVFGGGQEKGIRSGTEYVGGIAALSVAVERAVANVERNAETFTQYKQIIRDGLSGITSWRENCPRDASPAIMSLAFADIRGEVLLRMLESDGIVIGTGSACSSKKKHSRIAKAIGLDDNYAEGIVRISFSKYNTEEEVRLLAEKLAKYVVELRRTMLG